MSVRANFTIWFLISLTAAAVLIQGCSKEDDNGGINVPSSGAHEVLSTYGFFQGIMSDLVPKDRVVPYDLNSALFSDYALKKRYVYIPNGKKAEYDGQEIFNFPNGSVIIKNFYYLADFRDTNSVKRIMETRLLIKQSGIWNAETYVWNTEQTEATRFIAGKFIPVNWIDLQGQSKSTNYQVPNKNECKGCHEYNNAIIPIGPKARHLNRDYNYASGSQNQLEFWATNNLLSGSPNASAAPKLPVWDDPTSGTVDVRARAYLDINCGYCHNPNGPANNSGLHLEYQITTPGEWGVCKSPVAAGNGSGGRLYDILPGQPDGSILVYRLEVNDADIRMPELGRSIEHEEAVALIRQWITEMPGSCN